DLLRDGAVRQEIAILYRQKGPLFDAIKAALTNHRIAFLAERDNRYPGGALVQWLRGCALQAFGLSLPVGGSFESLLHVLHEWEMEAGLVDQGPIPLATRVRLFQTIESARQA